MSKKQAAVTKVAAQKTNNAIITNSEYAGNVSLKILGKDNKIRLIKSSHNEGTLALSKLFSMFMSGYPEAMNYIPKYLDLQYSSNVGIWSSYLKKESPLTAVSYYFDTSLSPSNWVTSATAIIPYGNLRESVDISSAYSFRLCLLSEDLVGASVNRELAYFYNITTKELAEIEEGTQAIIEWKMQLLHNEQVGE